MAGKSRYPQIPSTVWWGVRALLHRSPNFTFDERSLGVELGVQEAAARQYLTELRSVGILTEEGKATPLAQRWRLDESYAEAVEELIASTYPEGLRHIAPPGDADRQKVVNWFMREGLGQGAAGNKAATYLLMSSTTPNEAPSRASAKGKDDNGRRAIASRRVPPGRQSERSNRQSEVESIAGEEDQRRDVRRRTSLQDAVPLNINVQIHISADAGSEQIESIFSAMRRYLYDVPNN